LENAITTFIIRGRKRALKEAYDRSLDVKYSYYCITGDELVKSYRPFLPLLYNQVFRRGGRSYIMTNIEKETLVAVRDLTKAGAEVRHVDISVLRRSVIYDDSVAYFSITEPLITKSAMENVDQTEGEDLWVGSTEASVVESAKKHFLSDWKNAIPSMQKIQEIEEERMPVKTRILDDEDEITKQLIRLNTTASRLSICSVFGGMQMSHMYLFDSYQKILNNEVRSEESDEGIRWITNIDSRDSLDLIRIFLDAGIKVRHVKNLPPMSFGVSDKEIAATIEKMEGGKASQSFLVSNEQSYVDHFNSIFNELWRNGIDAIERIKDIEAGADLADIEVIPKVSRARELYFRLLKDTTHEVLLLFPTVNAFVRQERIITKSLLLSNTELRLPITTAATTETKAAHMVERNVKVRILMPYDQMIEQKVQNLKSSHNNIEIRYIEPLMLTTQATILVADRKNTLVMEIKDDSKTTFDEAIGLSTYSNSKAGVSSYVSIFENLWKQIELYEDIKKSHKQLMNLDKMQQEFINVAAHELRTPIQPVLSITQILHSKINDTQHRELLEIVIRNAKRLNRLSEEILDVARLESKSLELKKELFDLNDIILNAIDDIVLGTKFTRTNRLSYQPHKILLQADKSRIAEVISNFLNNAVKFTPQGTITIGVKEHGDNNCNNRSCIIVSVKDTGQGIDVNILPKLFTKFASKSHHGTGLGLFISKNIVEAHGGRIWAENNPVGIGATFSFSLPLY
jgi:two-component system, OmpR family, sensor histidine kinase VicK